MLILFFVGLSFENFLFVFFFCLRDKHHNAWFNTFSLTSNQFFCNKRKKNRQAGNSKREMQQQLKKKVPLASKTSHHRFTKNSHLLHLIPLSSTLYSIQSIAHVFRQAKPTTTLMPHSLLSSWLTPNPRNPHPSLIHIPFPQIYHPFISGKQNQNQTPTHFQIFHFLITLLVFCFVS